MKLSTVDSKPDIKQYILNKKEGNNGSV